MNAGSLFSGVGLLDLGLHMAGIRHAWGCESDPERRAIWERRFRAPCYADVREVDGRAPRVDLLAGGFPCQPFSTAGNRRKWDDERWLWPEFFRVVAELRPRFVLIENVPGLLATEWVDEPNDRCICGWPYRRRGFDQRHQEVDGPRRCGDDAEGQGGSSVARAHIRREGAGASRGDGGMGCGVERAWLSDEDGREIADRVFGREAGK